MFRIRDAAAVELELVRELLREYAQSLNFSLCFQNFEQELAELPGEYAPPSGGLWLAWADGQPIGCVALRRFDDTDAELKRLYVRPIARGRGCGEQLLQHALRAAQLRGYAQIRLDTTPTMQAAIALYRRLGFREIPAYGLNPIPGALYLAKNLSDRENADSSPTCADFS
ncbi:GNAT family N-acetyltransferase [Tuwongella immobilis]|uniref:N-acetyltransferase domain-containing protein n=1 Tax=Tuwongella immobilis TaxID=692036 RepID=A0A6C2YMH2_9BACT|nr:GNAT family N-acetyltransferase [Tuwongella immobilis]VIP02564.1 acetyltransferase : Acetyltransferase OS=Desulfovibrio sp. U5L GN=DesU5LDRAFT_1828 PE=4 SV=1: Acetyltransf_1 [Tuwongella immobilis]VTS01781.1 acetyltransferase : Acetyltransferase OS=Desulfovibrio sp. U5L GN=DesU5LDRAFT_1828 PE=4 SV=1: Acetyltransf_1 [Tuwongella immobilis]